MAEETFTKILEIHLNYEKAITGIAEYERKIKDAREQQEAWRKDLKNLDKQIDDLYEELKKGTITQSQYEASVASVKAQQKQVTEQMAASKVVVKQLKDEQAVLTKTIQNQVRIQNQNEGSLVSLRSELSNLTRKYDELSRAERNAAKGRDLQMKINNLTKELKGAEMETQRFYRNVGNYPQAMAQIGKGVSGIISTIPGLSGLGSAIGGVTSAIGGITSAIGGAVGTLGVFGAAAAATTAVVGALGAAFTSGAQTAISFNSAVSQLAAIRGTTADGVKELTNLAREYGATTKYTATEVVQLQTELAKLGYSIPDISNMTGSVLDFAQATGVSLAEAASLAGATLRMFEADTTRTTEYVDKMAAACTNSALDFSYLQTAMSTVGPVANAFGFKIEDVLALLGQLANAGFDASSAATATRNILLNLADTNGKLAQSLGKPVTNLDELVAGLKRLDDAGVNLAESLALTDKRSVSAFNTYLKQADGARQLRDTLVDADGAANQMATTMADNLQGDLNTLTSAWQEFSLKLNGTQGILRSIVQWLTMVVRKAGEVYGTLKYQLTDLYNNSIAFRGVMQTIGFVFKGTAEVIKASFGVLGDIVVGFGKTLKGAFTLDWELFGRGIEQFAAATGKNLHKMLVNIKNDAVDAAREIASGSIEVDENGNTPSSSQNATEVTETQKKVNKGMGITDDKTKNAQDKLRKAELEAQQAYEKSLTDLITDSAEKRRAQIIDKYGKEIADLELKLQTETKLSAEAQDNIRKTIANKRLQMQKDLDDLDAKISAEAIKRRQDEIALELAAVKKGTEQEFQIMLEQNRLKEQADIAAAERSISNKEELERRKTLIAAKYAAEEEKIQNERNKKLRELEEQALANRWTEQMMAAEDNDVEKAKIEVEKRKAELDALHQMETESDEAFKARQLEAEKAYNEAKKRLVEQENTVTQTRLEVASQVTKGISSVMEALGDDSKAFAKASKILALAEVAINTGKAIAAGVAQAQSVPFPANLAAIGTTVATVMANIATAISTIKSAKFAKGGLVDSDKINHANGGYISGAGTSTSDSIPAWLSNGEFVVNAAATRLFQPALEAMNNIGRGVIPQTGRSLSMASTSPETFTETLSRSLEEIHPVVSVTEIREVSQRVEVIENIDTI